MTRSEIRTQVLMIEPEQEMVAKVTSLLTKKGDHLFELTVVPDVPSALDKLGGDRGFDLLIMDFAFGGQAVDDIRGKDARIPIIFLGDRRDLTLAVEALRLGGSDFFPKETLDDHIFPQTLQRHHERHQLIMGVEQLEVRRERLEAMQELVVSVSEQISEPLEQMRKTVILLEKGNTDEKASKYLTLVRENLKRLSDKMERLRNLKDDKTVKYIKNIRMIDLS